MVSILLISAILFIAARIIHKDKELIDFTSMLPLVIVPAIVSFLMNMAISAIGLSPIFQLSGVLVAVVVVFFFSNSMFEWGYKRAATLAAVYLVASVLVDVGLMMLIGG